MIKFLMFISSAFGQGLNTFSIELMIDNQKVKLRTELREGANHIFRAIGMRPLNRIIQTELNSVVKRLQN